jgi:hypothetical protein
LFYRKLTAEQFEIFEQSLNGILQSYGQDNVFIGDNLVTVDRHVGFASDPDFMAAFNAEANSVATHALIWRLHTLCWAAQQAVDLVGDFVECGVYEGFSSAVVARYVGFAALDKRYWLYDLFDHAEETSGVVMPAHSPGLVGRVRRRFAAYPNLRVIKGLVPASFEQGAPERIAFMHLDLNDAAAEFAALDALFERISPGGLLILDDYGWKNYPGQKESADRFARSKRHAILELPTGQGLLIKK